MPKAATGLAPPIYAIEKSYQENANEGPFFNDPLPNRTWKKPTDWIDFLGFKLASPIGVPAGPLLNSKWIHLAANLGFDLVCYKTIRSFEHPGHPLPNVVYIDPFDPENPPQEAVRSKYPPEQMQDLAITNSFGMPSRSPSYLEKDIPLSNSLLAPGQAMVVSIVGTPGEGDFIEDFVSAALFAKECGAKIIEANFSCPNVTTGEGDIAGNPESVFEIAYRLVNAIGPTPLMIKVGTFSSTDQLRQTLYAAARAGVRAVSGINTISMKVVDEQGRPALGKDRLTSGVCGSPIRKKALEFVQSARTIIDRERLGLQIFGCGGITLPEHFQEFLDAGADIAGTATGMMWDPYIAMKYHEEQQ